MNCLWHIYAKTSATISYGLLSQVFFSFFFVFCLFFSKIFCFNCGYCIDFWLLLDDNNENDDTYSGENSEVADSTN